MHKVINCCLVCNIYLHHLPLVAFVSNFVPISTDSRYYLYVQESYPDIVLSFCKQKSPKRSLKKVMRKCAARIIFVWLSNQSSIVYSCSAALMYNNACCVKTQNLKNSLVAKSIHSSIVTYL